MERLGGKGNVVVLRGVSGAGVSFSGPISVAKAVESFPYVPVILAHAGSEMHNRQAAYRAAGPDNVFLEPSWVGVIGVGNMIRTVGCGKIMFSSDNIYQIPVEPAKYRSIINNEADLEKVRYKNAVRIYNLTI